MSVKKKSIVYGAAGAALAILAIAAMTYFAGLPTVNQPGLAEGKTSTLVIQLTDPPQVPSGTTSLNLTYSSLGLLVGEPTGSGTQVQTVTVTPTGGSATLDLLKLENISQTIGVADLPDGSVVYSVTLTVTSISIDVAGTVSPVTLATGNTFTVTLANNPVLHGTNLALLRLNPVVVDTSTGYNLIPSSVGVLQQSEGQGEGQWGFQHHLTSGDYFNLNHATGSTSANLLSLSVSGNKTTIEVQVTNTGSSNVTLFAIGFGGNFTMADSPQTSTTTSTQGGHMGFFPWNNRAEIAFVPVIPTTTTTSTSTSTQSCMPMSMQLVNGFNWGRNYGGLTLTPGECVDLNFSGVITFGGMFGGSSVALVPSTLAGQSYLVQVFASNGGNLLLGCTLPLGTNACTPQKFPFPGK